MMNTNYTGRITDETAFSPQNRELAIRAIQNRCLRHWQDERKVYWEINFFSPDFDMTDDFKETYPDLKRRVNRLKRDINYLTYQRKIDLYKCIESSNFTFLAGRYGLLHLTLISPSEKKVSVETYFEQKS